MPAVHREPQDEGSATDEPVSAAEQQEPRGPCSTIHLPEDVVDIVLNHAIADASPSQRQKLLHDCALVSKNWYCAAVRHLYRTPHIKVAGLRSFVKAVVPVTKAHAHKYHINRQSNSSIEIRAAGLNRLVKDIVLVDNTCAALVSSDESWIPDIISATRDKLENFCSHSTNISANVLHVLSQCSSLKRLDILRTDPSLGPVTVLTVAAGLPLLDTLRLPVFEAGAPSKLKFPRSLSWPPALRYLEVRGFFQPSDDDFLTFVDCLPPTLKSLKFSQFTHAAPHRGHFIYEHWARAPSVRDVEIEEPLFGHNRISLYDTIMLFPNSRTCTIFSETTALSTRGRAGGNEPWHHQSLENLILSIPAPRYIHAYGHTSRSNVSRNLTSLIHCLTRLSRVVLPEFCVHPMASLNTDTGILFDEEPRFRAVDEALLQRETHATSQPALENRGLWITDRNGVSRRYTENRGLRTSVWPVDGAPQQRQVVDFVPEHRIRKTA